ncbi:iron-sulfur cluster assembly scaffold protein [Candidatus Mycoplasma mahonii]|uniref:iron-sulfur cluster assembly scaffold protein n=1 Tax=Candidatus Mycoplasma mahonii TaxID=3004105 RepID=UPI0026ED0E99|nr:iron-sulfur cluster assembly scaffold protein [Candidatus Mycoplasma mahonii]WKX02575.1 iron-sulfur cluster assembly scaffold protein [Candidatus Mycoplasma mahonii]
MNKRNAYRSIIMDNYKNPSNFTRNIPGGYIELKASSLTCLDHFNIFIKTSNNLIFDILFNGEGCSISTSALNIMAKYLKGKNKKDAIVFLKNYEVFIKEGKTDNIELGDFVVFENVHIHLNRITCALMGSNTILTELESSN